MFPVQCLHNLQNYLKMFRSGRCVGVRGQFCGRCLEIRYGEDVREVDLNVCIVRGLQIYSGVAEPYLGLSTMQELLQLFYMQVCLFAN